MAVPESLEITKTVSEILAFLGASAFFGYKAVTGYLIVNVSVAGRLQRVHADPVWDDLAIAATLKKGATGSLELHDARVRVSWKTDFRESAFVGIERLSCETEKSSPWRRRILFGITSQTNPVLRLTPEEGATFSAVVRVPRSEVCTVEIAVTGRLTKGWKQGQWRTSLISLPVERSEPESTAG